MAMHTSCYREQNDKTFDRVLLEREKKDFTLFTQETIIACHGLRKLYKHTIKKIQKGV